MGPGCADDDKDFNFLLSELILIKERAVGGVIIPQIETKVVEIDNLMAVSLPLYLYL
jgi:hypothetical protein